MNLPHYLNSKHQNLSSGEYFSNNEETNYNQSNNNYNYYSSPSAPIIDQPNGLQSFNYELPVTTIVNKVKIERPRDPSTQYILQETNCEESEAIKVLADTNGNIISTVSIINANREKKMIEIENVKYDKLPYNSIEKPIDPSIQYILQETNCEEVEAIKVLADTKGNIIASVSIINANREKKMIEIENVKYDKLPYNSNKEDDIEKGDIFISKEEILKNTKDLEYTMT
jgi:hypothetical protein